MPNKKGSRLPLIVGLVVVFAITAIGISMQSCGGSKQIGTASSDPIVVDSVRTAVQGFKGRVVVVDFWATWCPPCRKGIPDLIDLQARYNSQGLEVVGVSVDPITPPRGRAEAVAPFMKEYGINYTIYMVKSQAAIEGYNINEGIPTTYIIDREGRIAKTFIGYQPKQILESEIKKLL